MRGVTMTMMAVAVVVGTLATAGCGSSEPDASATPRYGVEPTGSALEIEPLDSLEGSERYSTDLFGIDVPAGMETSTQTLDDGSEVLVIREQGADRASVIVTATAQEDATDEHVDVSSIASAARLAGGDLVPDLKRVPARWDGLEYAVALTGTLHLETDGVALLKDLVAVTTRDPERTSVVILWAEAPEGELASSDAYAALRTFRFGD